MKRHNVILVALCFNIAFFLLSFSFMEKIAKEKRAVSPPSPRIVLSNIVQYFLDDGHVNWSKGVIKATGMGVSAKFAKNEAQAKATARRAAVVDAQRNLGEMINAIVVDSETTIRDLDFEESCSIEEDARQRVPQVLSEQQNPDGSYEVTMGIPMYGEASLCQLLYPMVFRDIPEKPDEDPPNVEGPATAGKVGTYVPDGGENYTGLIVDCIGLHLFPAICPELLDEEGRNIYGKMNANQKFALNVGIVGYWPTIEKAERNTERVGNTPLIVKAISKKGSGIFAVNPVIKTHDSWKIRMTNHVSQYLNQCKVLFVIDPLTDQYRGNEGGVEYSLCLQKVRGSKNKGR